jgi:hypothetical protein
VVALHDVTSEEFALVQAEIVRLDGVEDVMFAGRNILLAWTEPNRMFGRGEPFTLGNHGSPRCTQQMAIVSGGHPAAKTLGAAITRNRPGTLTWAPTIRRLLEI